MKKSNIILVVLLATLYIMPAVVWGFYKVSSNGEYYTGFGDEFRFIQIENPGLTKQDILINTERVSEYSGFKMNNRVLDASYIYDKGSRRYLPEINREGDSLYVGKATDAPSGEKLKLHIHINGLYEIRLNGETVWRR